MRSTIKSVANSAPIPKITEGIACGKNAKTSSHARPGTRERNTTQENATLRASAMVGVRTTRMSVFLRPDHTKPQGKSRKLASETASKARAEGNWKNGNNAAQIRVRPGKANARRK